MNKAGRNNAIRRRPNAARPALVLVLILALCGQLVGLAGGSTANAAGEIPPGPPPCVGTDTTNFCVRHTDFATISAPTGIGPGSTGTVRLVPSIPECTHGEADDATKVPVPCWWSSLIFDGLVLSQTVPPGGQFPEETRTGDCEHGYFAFADLACPFTISSYTSTPLWMRWSASISVYESNYTDNDLWFKYGSQTVAMRNYTTQLATYYSLNSPPTVGLGWEAAGTAGTFNFFGDAAATSPATIVRWDWDFGDGDVRTNSTNVQTKTWTGEAATRTIKLTVTDSFGQQATDTEVMKPALDVTAAPRTPSNVKVGDNAFMRITVGNVGPSTITNVAPDFTIGPAGIASRTQPITPASMTLEPGQTGTFTAPFNALDHGTATGTVFASGTSAGKVIKAAKKGLQFPIGNTGLKIDLDGQVVEVGKSFAIGMTITNQGAEALDDITWTDPTGLLLESGNNPASAQPSVSYVRGPDEPLPTSMDPGASVRRVYVFNAPFLGTTVLTAAAHATSRDSGAVVEGQRAITVMVVDGWSAAARDQLVIGGLYSALGAVNDSTQELAQTIASQVIAALTWNDPTAKAIASTSQSGISNKQLRLMVAASASTPQSEPRELLDAWVEGFTEKKNEFGEAGGQALANMYAAIEDPEQRQAIATKMWNFAKDLPADTWTNTGYLGKAIVAPLTVDGLQTIATENGKVVDSVKAVVSETAAGIGPVIDDYRKEYQNNPKAARRSLVKFSGGLAWTAAESGMSTAVGEAGTAAVAKVVSPVAKSAIGMFRRGGEAVGDESVAVAGVANASEDAAQSMAARMDQAQSVVDNYQALPADTVIDIATVTGKGGLLAEDATVIQNVIKKANAKFGVEFEIATRTSEPLSAGIEGIAKPEFIKPKAVSVLDQMIGGDPARAGKVGLFKPVPLADDVVAELEAANPGFAAKYQERLQAQVKNWEEWSPTVKPGEPPPPPSKLKILTDAGERYKNDGGITVLLERPGNKIPYDIKYLEQLKEPEFLAAHGIDPADVPGIRQQIADANIDTIKAAPIATVSPSGTVYIDDALTNLPYLSDCDIQMAGPKNGIWPKGHSRGEIETFFKAELSKLKRFPFHGWSDAAFDLPADYYKAAVPFQLGNANPATAFATAKKIAGRLQSMENIARAKSAALLAAGDVEGSKAVLKWLDGFAKFKEPGTGLYSAEKLLKEYPPGEKTINFTAGDIRVGYGNGGN